MPKIVDTRHEPDEDDLKLDSLVQLLRNGVGLFHRRHHIDQVLLQQPRIYLCFSAEVEKRKKMCKLINLKQGHVAATSTLAVNLWKSYSKISFWNIIS